MYPPEWPSVVRWRPWTMLRSARVNAGLSQDELARELHVSRKTISLLERHRSQPSLSLALALARRFDLSVEDLFPEDERR